jgi:hypothetical protein
MYNKEVQSWFTNITVLPSLLSGQINHSWAGVINCTHKHTSDLTESPKAIDGTKSIFPNTLHVLCIGHRVFKLGLNDQSVSECGKFKWCSHR